MSISVSAPSGPNVVNTVFLFSIFSEILKSNDNDWDH